ncbi:FAD-dependent oxidoreductase [bacterium]|nr:FAD-dependent oxidoreductase [bacterium]
MRDGTKPVLIVGGGISGLCCARSLHRSGIPFQIFEQSDQVGGRIRTDIVQGFLLDRGFQALQTAYPEAQAQLDYSRLKLKPYLPGSLVHHSGCFHRMIDPWRRPVDGLWSGLNSSVGTLLDKFRIARLRRAASSGKIEDLFSLTEMSSLESLQKYGFSSQMIDRFFRPLLGGIFLERELVTSHRMLHFVFRMMSLGDVALPEQGMQAIPDQLAEELPKDQLHLNAAVQKISNDSTTLENGQVFRGSQVVLATPGNITAKLIGHHVPDFQSVKCLYYACEKPPTQEPILILNGGDGPINNMSVPSLVACSYAPSNKHLVSISVLDDSNEEESLQAAVIKQAKDWFGEQVDQWSHLETYDIKYAIPSQNAGRNLKTGHANWKNDLIICGDSIGHASIQSALESGLHAAELVMSRCN